MSDPWTVAAVIATAVATTVYAALTLLILFETRAQREARVEVIPQPWDKGHMYLAVDLVNIGPAPATDVSVRIDLLKEGVPVAGSHKGIAQPVLAVGDRRRFLPEAGGKVTELKDMVAQDLVLQAVWDWRDGRRTLPRFRTRVHHRELVRPLSEVASDYYQGGALVEHDENYWLERIAENTKKLAAK